jgi:hypothetical protein
MAEGRREHDWNRTSSEIATLMNVNRGSSSPVIHPDSINPMVPKKRRQGKKLSPRKSVLAIGDLLGIPRPPELKT